MDALGGVTITAPSGVTANTPGSAFTTIGDATVGGNLAVASGASGVFSTGTGQTVTVQDGIVIDIS